MRGEGKVSIGRRAGGFTGVATRGWIHRDRVERRRARGEAIGEIDAPPPRGARARSKFESSSERGRSGRGAGRARAVGSSGFETIVRASRARDGPRSGVETGKDSRSRKTLLPIERGGIHPRAVRARTRGLDGFRTKRRVSPPRRGAGSSLTVVDAEYLQPPGLSRSPRGRVSSPRREDHGGEARAPSRRTSSAGRPRSPPVPSRQGSARGARGARDAAPRGRRRRRRRRRGRARGPPFARVPRAARSALHGRGRRRR